MPGGKAAISEADKRNGKERLSSSFLHIECGSTIRVCGTMWDVGCGMWDVGYVLFILILYGSTIL